MPKAPSTKYNTHSRLASLRWQERPRSPTPARGYRRRPTPYPERNGPGLPRSLRVGPPPSVAASEDAPLLIVPSSRRRQPSVITISSDSEESEGGEVPTPEVGVELDVQEQGEASTTDQQQAADAPPTDIGNVGEPEVHLPPNPLIAAVKEHVLCGICYELLWDPYA
ncbi:hypothetical protein AAF712_016128, partial [Marasmius tenuissimus]